MTPAALAAPPSSDDLTLDELRLRLAPAIAREAAFDGWGRTALHAAAAATGTDPDVARVAFPGGAVDMIDAWFAAIDAAMRDALPAERLARMKIRERITALVEARLAILTPDVEALRRARDVLAQPQNVARATRLGWRAADVMWRAAGDTATDYNHYTKRAMLGAVYASTLAVFLDDDSEGHADTRAFLARRIQNVMDFEGWKHRTMARREHRPSLSRFLGRLRYPPR